MPQLSPSLALLTSRRHGIVTTDDLIADGFTANSIRRLVTAGVIGRCHQGVYRLATAPDTFESRCAAACLGDTTAVISGVAAARLWQFRHVRNVDEPIVLVEHDRSPLTRGVLLRRTNVLDADDWNPRDDGIRVASAPRAWFDCARDLDDDRFEMLTEWLIDRHASIPTLWRMRRRLSQRGRPGLARVNRVLSQRAVWQRPADSGIEYLAIRAIERRTGIKMVRQHPIRLPNGVIVHPDGALPDIRWAVEVDHVTWHGGRLDAQRDKGRDRKLRRVGWQVDRVTDVELREQFDATIFELIEILTHRLQTHAA